MKTHSNNKEKILFVASFIVGGGAAKVLLNIINSLPLNRYDIKLLVVSPMPHEYFYVKDGVFVVFCNKTHAIKASGDVVKEIRGFAPDYLFSTDYFSYLLPVFKLFSSKPLKFFARINVPPSEYPNRTLKRRLAERISRITFRFTDRIIAQTQFMKDDLIAWYGINPEKIEVIQNIIDPDMLTVKGNEISYPEEFKPEKYNVLAAGALYSIKGFDLLVESIAEVRKTVPNINLVIIGKERYELDFGAKLLAIITENHLEDCVTLAGYRENPYPYFKHADLFVLSSRKEAFPNVVLESLFFGTPVVATNVVDFSGVIEQGCNGYVVQKESSVALACGIVSANKCINKPCGFIYKNYDYSQLFSK